MSLSACDMELVIFWVYVDEVLYLEFVKRKYILVNQKFPGWNIFW